MKKRLNFDAFDGKMGNIGARNYLLEARCNSRDKMKRKEERREQEEKFIVFSSLILGERKP